MRRAFTVDADHLRDERVAVRAAELFDEDLGDIQVRTDRMFAVLLLVQWIAGICFAFIVAPRTWSGTVSSTNMHVWAAVFLGGAISALPICLAVRCPGYAFTRHIIAVAQMLSAALLIHLTGGRIETHFHIFGSLAFLALYRDWRVLVTATIVTALDHFLRGAFAPMSVYGVLAATPWRAVEHAGWVLFENIVLLFAMRQSISEMRASAMRKAGLEVEVEQRSLVEDKLRVAHGELDERVRLRTHELETANIALMSEIDVRRRVETELLVAKEQAEAANLAKSAFLASMSHEIRTPMNGVIGMNDLLLDTELSPTQHEFASAVHSSADALLTIINDILDLSKIEAGRLELEPVPFDLRTIVEEASELLSAKAHDKGVDLIARLAPEAPTSLRGDPGRIRQIVINLLGNAVKFTEHGHVFLNVDCTELDESFATLSFSVEDTGIGIPQDHIESVFERFSQADSSTTRRFGGTGLGLTISRQLVEMMGGTLTATSSVGIGSTFRFTIRLPLLEQAGSLASSESVEGIHVLIVDDNRMNQRVLVEQVSAWKMRAEAVGTGWEAIDALRRALDGGDPFAAAILDYQMPGMDGEALTRTIRMDPSLARTPIVMLTSAGMVGETRRMAEAGVTEFLVKPARSAQILDALIRAHAKAHVPVVEAKLPRASTTPIGTSAATPQPLKKEGVRVLLVEDQKTNQRVATVRLEQLGCNVDIAKNGVEAVAMVAAGSYELVFMDCHMPEMDGYEATATIRAQQAGGWRIPIVAMTANAMQGDRELCIAAGMDDYITKPVTRDAFATSLERWVRAVAEIVPATADGQ